MTRIPCRGLNEAQAWDAVRLALLTAGFRGERSSVTGAPSTFARSVRPPWVLPVVVLTALPTAGVSLLLLLLRRSETCSAAVEDTHRGVTLQVTGRVPATTLDALKEAACAQPGIAAHEPAQPAELVAAAVSSARDLGMAGIAPPLPPPPPLATPTRQGHSADAEFTVISDRTAVSDATDIGQPSGVRVQLITDQGHRIVLDSIAYLGRNPQIPQGAPQGQLIQVPDPACSLSKTHFAAGTDRGVAWIRDLASTNGTMLVEGNGARHPLAPGEFRTIRPGDRIQAGDRWFRVEPAVPTPPSGDETVMAW